MHTASAEQRMTLRLTNATMNRFPVKLILTFAHIPNFRGIILSKADVERH